MQAQPAPESRVQTGDDVRPDTSITRNSPEALEHFTIIRAGSRFWSRLFPPVRPWIFRLVFLWTVLATIPAPPQVTSVGMDASWAHALNLAHAWNFVFGRDVVFTFGPLGYLFYPDPPLVAPLPVFVYNWAVQALFLLGVFLIWRSFGNRLIVLLNWVILTGAFLLFDLPFEKMQLSFLSAGIGIVALFATRGNAAFGFVAVAGAAAGLMLLFKANEAIAACVVFYSVLASWYLHSRNSNSGLPWRRVRVLALIPPLAFVLGFVLVERNVTGLWSYATGSMQIALGYSEGMAYPGPSYQVILAIYSLAALGLFPLIADNRRALVAGLAPALLAGFFAYKSGVVRQDGLHTDLLQVKLAVAGLFLLVCARSVRDQRLIAAFVVASFLFGAETYRESFPVQTEIATRRAALLDAPENTRANWNISSTWARLGALSRQGLDTVRMDAAVSNLVSGGSVDDVPFELDVVEANGWRWNPRPVFQGYSAYTPALDEWNARHLASRESADHIIMQWAYIENKQPLLDDTASWRALFDHYDVELTRPEFLVLKRRETPRYLDPRPIGSASAVWQSDIAVPAPGPNEFTMMRAEVDKSLYGALRGTFYRNSHTFLNVTYSSGAQQRWQVTRANLADGAFVAYLPRKLGEVLPYFGQPGEYGLDRVISIRFETPGLMEFASTIRISWYAVGLRQAGSGSIPAPKPPTVEPVRGGDALTHRLEAETQGFIDDVNGQKLSTNSFKSSSSSPITISGWAVDASAHTAARAVYIDVDGKLFAASYGSSRADVANTLKEPRYQNSGFSGRIVVTPGSHRVGLRIVSAAGNGYYAGPSFLLNAE